MRLELVDFPVKDVQLGNRISYNKGVLELNKEELLSLVLKDTRISSAGLDVVFPGEKTRIVRIRDVVEPRLKVSGPGCVFPGIRGPVETVGEGRTHRLSGFSVIASVEYRPTVPSGTGSQNASILDMWGPGSMISPLGSTINAVLTLKLIDNVTELEAHDAILSAECKVAERLAEATRNSTSKNVEVFELSKVDPSLPRIVYILCCLTTWHDPHSGHALYGLPVRESLPTFLHPNELIDGALTSDARKGAGQEPLTWAWMNTPLVFKLLREHGKRLNFLGVILQRTRFESEFGKEVTAACTSQMARLLGADGAILTRISPSGNNLMDVIFTVEACEKKGVKTVFLTPEYSGKDGTELPLYFYTPEATAMVSSGRLDRQQKLPAPTKVIGAKKGELVQVVHSQDPPFDPWSEYTTQRPLELAIGADWLGGMNRTCKEY